MKKKKQKGQRTTEEAWEVHKRENPPPPFCSVHLNVINRDSVRAVLEGEKNERSSDLKARSSRSSVCNVTFSEAVSYKPEYSPI